MVRRLGYVIAMAVLALSGLGEEPSFVDAPGSPIEVEDAWYGAIGDFNEDGSLDIAVVNQGFRLTDPDRVSVLLGNGTGRFTGPVHVVIDGRKPASVTAADLDGDGHLDLAVGNDTGTLSILLGDGTGKFHRPFWSPLMIDPCSQCLRWMGTGDLDEDGRPDFVVVNELEDLVVIRLNVIQLVDDNRR
ncbi:MAG TPA: VCBS repeat-containing protein [Candidatus Acetothermia bacterium]|nr:VCBS repeat-containing protein [Candidatus Acetothermia bacterium]